MKRLALALFTAFVFVLAGQAMAGDLHPRALGDYDQYVLALSWQPGFCQSMHDAGGALPAECAAEPDQPDRSAYLTLHGLWPSLPRSLEGRVAEKNWQREGCRAADPSLPAADADHKCGLPVVPLSTAAREGLAAVMPGAGGRSCLERYEYAKHGMCFGFEPDAYFGKAAELDREVRAGGLGRFLGEHYGRRVTLGQLLGALTPLFGPEAARRVEVLCHGEGAAAYLTEIRIPLKREAVNAPLNSAALGEASPRHKCAVFVIDPRGF